MDKGYFKVNMNDVEDSPFSVYMDGGIAILDSIRELPHDNDNCFRLTDMIAIVACTEGKMSVNIDSNKVTIRAGEFMLCPPNVIVNDCMTSTDYRGKIFCISGDTVRDTIRIENAMWNKAFSIRKNPVVHIGRENMRLFKAYDALITLRSGMRRMYGKEVMFSLIRAMLYDIVAEVSESDASSDGQLMLQQKKLFKRFMELLASCEVKPRNVTWYGERLYVSAKYLSTVCKQVSGKTAFKWIDEFVMTDIRNQLKYSGRTIKETAFYLGFPNLSFFGRYVKRHTGQCPSDYQKTLLEEAAKVRDSTGKA